jgi:hypothetical protein
VLGGIPILLVLVGVLRHRLGIVKEKRQTADRRRLSFLEPSNNLAFTG